MSRFSDAAFRWMTASNLREVRSDELWNGLKKSNPELTTPSEHRKTPRATLMRDLRKDDRFKVSKGRIVVGS